MGYKHPRPTKYTFKAKRGLSGLGLFTEMEIPRDEFVIEYWGTIVSDDEADEVGGKYLFRLENEKTILGNHKENKARLLNHSCKPNCVAEMDGKRIFIYARRKIQPSEELTYDYGKEYWADFIGQGCKCGHCKKKTHTQKKKLH